MRIWLMLLNVVLTTNIEQGCTWFWGDCDQIHCSGMPSRQSSFSWARQRAIKTWRLKVWSFFGVILLSHGFLPWKPWEDLSSLSLGTAENHRPDVGEILHTAGDVLRVIPKGLLQPLCRLATRPVSEQFTQGLKESLLEGRASVTLSCK